MPGDEEYKGYMPVPGCQDDAAANMTHLCPMLWDKLDYKSIFICLCLSFSEKNKLSQGTWDTLAFMKASKTLDTDGCDMSIISVNTLENDTVVSKESICLSSQH